MAPVNVKKAAEVSGFYCKVREKRGRTGAQKILNFIFDSVKQYFPIIFGSDKNFLLFVVLLEKQYTNFLLFVVLQKYNSLFKLFLIGYLTQAVNVKTMGTVVDAVSNAAKEPAG